MTASRKEKLEAQICNELDELGYITMYGREIHNPKPLKGKRTSYHIHPYTKQGTGVSCTVTYTDTKTHIPYVLLSKKTKSNQFGQIGGYTRGQGPEGSAVNYEKRSDDERDRDEEKIIGNENAVKVLKSDTSSSTSAYTLKQLKDASMQGFLEQQKKKLGSKINPILMKETLARQGVIYKMITMLGMPH